MSKTLDEREERITGFTPTTKLNRLARRWGQRRGVRQYSDEEIGTALAVLDYYSGNALRTARELGIPRMTLVEWAKREKLPPGVVSVRQRKREEFAHLSDEAAEWVITSITRSDVRKAGLRDKVVAYGILRDKSAQDRGELTQVVEHRITIVKRAYEDIRALVPQDEARRLLTAQFDLKPEDWKVIEGEPLPHDSTTETKVEPS